MSMPKAVRHINEIRAVRDLFRAGPMSRADLARSLSVTRSTAGNIVQHLIEQGLIRETSDSVSPEGRTGRPGQLLSLRGEHCSFLGAEIGVEKLTLVAMDLSGRVSTTVSRPHRQGTASETIRDTLNSMIAEYAAGLPSDPNIQGVCITVPGLLSASGEVLSTPILGWANTDVKSIFRDGLADFGEVLFENDANAFATAETYLGKQRDDGTSLFILIDAGVGGGLFSDGKLIRGQNGYAGEIGHMPMGEQGYATSKVIPGSFESYVGKEAILNRVRYFGGSASNIEEIAEGYLSNETPMRLAVSDWARWIGRGLAVLTASFDPGRIVVGGDCAPLVRVCLSEIEIHLSKMLLAGRPLPTIEISALGPEVVSLGAASMLHRDFLSIDPAVVFGADSSV